MNTTHTHAASHLVTATTCPLYPDEPCIWTGALVARIDGGDRLTDHRFAVLMSEDELFDFVQRVVPCERHELRELFEFTDDGFAVAHLNDDDAWHVHTTDIDAPDDEPIVGTRPDAAEGRR